MRRNIFHAKIHRAVVTHADLNYEGSVTIDSDLMGAADILPSEAVHIWNLTRGTRLMTYAISGPPGSGIVCINGAAAHLNAVGDRVILATFVDLDEDEARSHRARIVRVDDSNRIVDVSDESAGPRLPHPHP